ncbi:MAG: hypothetical protein BVN34_08610 [Proteobacteria bacterium ST_bin12]|nr:MAG: hypothetical protein BVN34_08610 [Proteobacteria bacterium ST_bin12]
MMDEPIIDGNDDKLAAVIEAMIPKSMDDIIRKNREVVQLRLANETDISKLQAEIEEDNPVFILDNWNLLAFDRLGVTTVHLIGDVRGESEPRITSKAIEIDMKRHVLTTISGNLYRMGSRNDGEPNTEKLYLICAYMHEWGIGQMLGVPHFFY